MYTADNLSLLQFKNLIESGLKQNITKMLQQSLAKSIRPPIRSNSFRHFTNKSNKVKGNHRIIWDIRDDTFFIANPFFVETEYNRVVLCGTIMGVRNSKNGSDLCEVLLKTVDNKFTWVFLKDFFTRFHKLDECYVIDRWNILNAISVPYTRL